MSSVHRIEQKGVVSRDLRNAYPIRWRFPSSNFRVKAMQIQPYLPSARTFIGRACQIRSYSSQVAFEPLRILFCGSDEFSIASLRALYKEHERDKALIESIDVVCRPAKPVGRGLKDVREGNPFRLGPPCLVLNKNQYPFPSLQRNLPCLYIKLTRSPSGRSVIMHLARYISVEMDLATNTSWLASKLDCCRLVWSSCTSTDTSSSQIRRAQCPPFHVT